MRFDGDFIGSANCRLDRHSPLPAQCDEDLHAVVSRRSKG